MYKKLLLVLFFVMTLLAHSQNYEFKDIYSLKVEAPKTIKGNGIGIFTIKAKLTNNSNDKIQLREPVSIGCGCCGWGISITKDSIPYNFSAGYVTALGPEVNIRKGESHTFVIPLNIKHWSFQNEESMGKGKYDIQLNVILERPNDKKVISEKATIWVE